MIINLCVSDWVFASPAAEHKVPQADRCGLTSKETEAARHRTDGFRDSFARMDLELSIDRPFLQQN